MKILRLSITDVKRIVAADITPRGHVVELVGKNAQGKTSVLDSIEMVLSGKESIPPRPVRQGAKSGRVTMDLGDVVATRTFTPEGGGSLKIEAKVDETTMAVIRSPQTWLNERIGRLALDPLAFMRQDAKQQGETLRRLVGLDTAALDAERKAKYEERAALNREVRNAEGALAAMPVYPDAPAEPVSAEAIHEEILQAAHANRAKQEAERVAVETQGWVARAKSDLDNRMLEITQLEERLRDLRASLEVLRENHSALERQYLEQFEAARQLPLYDEEPLLERLAQVGEINAQVKANADVKAAQEALEAKAKAADGLTAAIAHLDAEKALMLSRAPFPVPGLGFDEEGGVTFNGLPLSQASGAEQTRVSMAVALALNPKLKLVLIRDASLLDEDSLALVTQMAEEADAQVWLERVGDGDAAAPGSILIEDGTAKEVDDRA